MCPEDELAFFSPFHDERFATVPARRGLFAPQQTLGRHAGDRGFLAVRTGDIPAQTGANPQRLAVFLGPGDHEIVIAGAT